MDKLFRMWIHIFKLMCPVYGILRIAVQRMAPQWNIHSTPPRRFNCVMPRQRGGFLRCHPCKKCSLLVTFPSPFYDLLRWNFRVPCYCILLNMLLLNRNNHTTHNLRIILKRCISAIHILTLCIQLCWRINKSKLTTFRKTLCGLHCDMNRT